MNRKINTLQIQHGLLHLGILLVISACSPETSSQAFDYGTSSDSARYYYIKGWQEILDHGRWIESERSFRKTLEFDPNYLLGKSQVGRITRDLNEREAIYEDILSQMTSLSDDERLLLDVYLKSIEATNNRDKGIEMPDDFMSNRKLQAESNFRKFIYKHPEDDYVKAEYIEWLHFIHGPQIALDSLKTLASPRQKELGFYISFAASLELELDKIDNAIALSESLEKLMGDSTYTSYMKLKAEIYLTQDSLQKAKECIDRVVRIDPKHQLAVRFQTQINEKLENN